MKKEVFEKEGLTFVRVENEKLRLTLANLGASIYRIEYHNIPMNLVPFEKDFAKEQIYHGKTIGPLPNRWKGNEVFVNDKKYILKNNEGENTLHGGHDGYSTQLFEYSIEEKNDYINVAFKLHLKEGEHSLPGDITLVVNYHLEENDDSFLVTFTALSSRDTYLSLTNHAFFTLGDPNINRLSLKIPAFEFLKSDKDTLLPVEKQKIIDCLDFNELKSLVIDINDPFLVDHKTKGYDHNFYLDDAYIVLSNNKYELDIFTNFECVQVYTDNYADGANYYNTRDEIRRGVAIEPQDDYLNRQILKGGETYYRFIKYTFKSL